jgi:hypothetical protein
LEESVQKFINYRKIKKIKELYLGLAPCWWLLGTSALLLGLIINPADLASTFL